MDGGNCGPHTFFQSRADAQLYILKFTDEQSYNATIELPNYEKLTQEVLLHQIPKVFLLLQQLFLEAKICMRFFRIE